MARKSNPLKYASGYSVDLYCDQAVDAWQHKWIGQFTGESKAECMREARRLGWKIHPDRTATCPICMWNVNEGLKQRSKS